MSFLFRPNGTLNVATAATDLPSATSENKRDIVSVDFQRCKNLSLDRTGRVDLRPGSTRFTNTITQNANFIIEQGGNRYSFSNTAIHKDEISIATGLATAQWSAFKYNAFNDTTQQIFALNGTDRKRIDNTTVSEWGIAAPTTKPTLAVGAGTGLTGDYNAKYTYLRKVGTTIVTESNPSPAASSATTLTNEDLSVTVTASTDTQVTHVRIYRTLTGGGVYFVDQDLAVGTTQVDTSTTDANLGAEVATNHDRPPLGSIVAGPFYNGVTFIAKDNLLYYSLSKQPEYFPTNNNIEVGSKQFPIKAIIDFGGQAYCLTKAQIWFIQGTGSGGFLPIAMRSLAGAPNLYGAIGIEGRGIYHIGPDGIYLFAGGRDKKITQDNFEPLFRNENVNDIPGVADISTAWLHQFENRLYFHYGNGSLLVLNLDNERWTYYKYDLAMSGPATDHENDRFIAGDAQKFVRQLEDRTATTDSGTAIDWELESKDFSPQTRRNFSRLAKWDVDASDGTSVTGSVIYDGAIHQSHTLTGDRNTRRRLIKPGNGNRMSLRATGSGPITFYGAETE